MYLSKVIIARAWSRDLYQLHQGLWHLFPNRPDAARDFLFHVEKRNTPEGLRDPLIISPKRNHV